jgi:predicted DCC family thiol-disulfide oxidoreductase YuxK
MDNQILDNDLSNDLDSSPIIFFDGVCNLCNWAVDLVIKNDSLRKFRFAPLQGETAKALLPKGVGKTIRKDGEDGWSMVLLDGKGYYERSRAALLVGKQLKGPISIMARVGLAMPRFLGDFVYRWIAANRYKIFGKKETCRLPTTEERALFLP